VKFVWPCIDPPESDIPPRPCAGLGRHYFENGWAFFQQNDTNKQTQSGFSLPSLPTGLAPALISCDRVDGRFMIRQESAELQPRSDTASHGGRTPIYLQDWWWNIASGGRHRFVAVYEDGREVGRLTYFPLDRYFLGFCKLTEGVHAPWTRYCAPIIEPDCSVRSRVDDIAHNLARQLPRGMSYRLTCPHYTDRAVPAAFEREGFGIATQKSYLLDLRGATDVRVVAQLDMSTRQRFRKAQKRLDVVEIAPSMFFQLYRLNLAAREKTSYEDLDVAESLAVSCQTRGMIRVTAAKVKEAPCDDLRSYHAAIACLQDEAFSYYWMSTRNIKAIDPAVRNGAVKLLIVDAITHASRAGLIFDFDGAVADGSGEMYRGFRGAEVNRYVLTRKTMATRAVEALRPVVSGVIATRARRGRPLPQLE
jgi:hypothetical protein